MSPSINKKLIDDLYQLIPDNIISKFKPSLLVDRGIVKFVNDSYDSIYITSIIDKTNETIPSAYLKFDYIDDEYIFNSIYIVYELFHKKNKITRQIEWDEYRYDKNLKLIANYKHIINSNKYKVIKIINDKEISKYDIGKIVDGKHIMDKKIFTDYADYITSNDIVNNVPSSKVFYYFGRDNKNIYYLFIEKICSENE
jgi:hypothetical protein